MTKKEDVSLESLMLEALEILDHAELSTIDGGVWAGEPGSPCNPTPSPDEGAPNSFAEFLTRPFIVC